jgi:CheY-like chemotaxis protein
MLLEFDGHNVRISRDRGQDLDAARARPPDVMILDLGLPRMDGYEMARRCRSALPRQPRLMAVTGYGQAKDVERSFAEGFDLHRIKLCRLVWWR